MGFHGMWRREESYLYLSLTLMVTPTSYLRKNISKEEWCVSINHVLLWDHQFSPEKSRICQGILCSLLCRSTETLKYLWDVQEEMGCKNIIRMTFFWVPLAKESPGTFQTSKSKIAVLSPRYSCGAPRGRKLCIRWDAKPVADQEMEPNLLPPRCDPCCRSWPCPASL